LSEGKFNRRAEECVLLGYPEGVKGYRLWSIASQKIVVSKDVIFFEDIFPFKISTSIKKSIPRSQASEECSTWNENPDDSTNDDTQVEPNEEQEGPGEIQEDAGETQVRRESVTDNIPGEINPSTREIPGKVRPYASINREAEDSGTTSSSAQGEDSTTSSEQEPAPSTAPIQHEEQQDLQGRPVRLRREKKICNLPYCRLVQSYVPILERSTKIFSYQRQQSRP